MSYLNFRTQDPDFRGRPPCFHDTDGSPVYEGPYHCLLNEILYRDDVAALKKYRQTHERIIRRAYSMDRDNPFVIALERRSFRTLRALVESYSEDRAVAVSEMQRTMQEEHGQRMGRRSREEEMTLSQGSWTETVQEYLWRHELSLMDAACRAADREFVEWLLAQEPPLGSLRERDCLGRMALMSAAMGLGSSDLEDEREDAVEPGEDENEEQSWEEAEERRREHHEAFIR